MKNMKFLMMLMAFSTTFPAVTSAEEAMTEVNAEEKTPTVYEILDNGKKAISDAQNAEEAAEAVTTDSESDAAPTEGTHKKKRPSLKDRWNNTQKMIVDARAAKKHAKDHGESTSKAVISSLKDSAKHAVHRNQEDLEKAANLAKKAILG